MGLVGRGDCYLFSLWLLSSVGRGTYLGSQVVRAEIPCKNV